jgi:hypothetical protein
VTELSNSAQLWDLGRGDYKAKALLGFGGCLGDIGGVCALLEIPFKESFNHLGCVLSNLREDCGSELPLRHIKDDMMASGHGSLI